MSTVNQTPEYKPATRNLPPAINSLASVIRLALTDFSQHLRVAMPAKVVAVTNDYRVNLQPLPQAQYLAEDGPTTLPVLPGVPVVMPGGVNWQVKYPIDVGDVGLALFADRSLDSFLAGKGEPAPVNDARLHHITDAVYLPGLAYDSLAAQRDDQTDDLVMRNGSAEVRLERNGTFRIYSGPTNNVELVDLIGQLSNQVQTLVQTLQAAMTVTMMGPQPLYGPTQVSLNTALTALQKITSSLGQLKGS